MNRSEAVKWLKACATYFEQKDDGGEDKAAWAKRYNAENAHKIAALLADPAAERMAETLRDIDAATRQNLKPGVIIDRVRERARAALAAHEGRA